MNRESDLGGRAHACDLSIPLGHRQNKDLSRLPRSMETRTCERLMQRL